MKLQNAFRSLAAGAFLLAGVAAASAQSIDLTGLHQFTVTDNDGVSPYSELILGADGGLYGTTRSGGTNFLGTVFRMNPDGSQFTVIHHFGNGSDGMVPYGGVIQGVDGFLYGTTYFGGTNDDGTIFKLSTNGLNYSILYHFSGSADGSNPWDGLIQGLDGALYGTTWLVLGAVFKIDTNGNNFTVLHAFTSSPDAAEPQGSLVQAGNGMLYGTTTSGGTNFLGTVFQINPNGSNYSVIHSFNGSSDGSSPDRGLMIGRDGWLYGTTVDGGNSSAESGTVFKLNTNGAGFVALHTFTNSPDGANPYTRVTQGNDGYLYGVTTYGGNTNGYGTIFRLNTNGMNYSILHQFNGNGDGDQPWAGLFTTGNGVFYGTTSMGGDTDSGTVYRLALVPTLNLNVSDPSVPLLTFTGLANQSCQVQASSNLLNWNFLTNVILTNGSSQISDPTATNSPARYYRVVIP
jgi:uncharacterized repeat protein (TIGR03803 family)